MLNLNYCRGLDDAGLKPFGRFKKSRELSIGSANIAGPGLRRWPDLPLLESVTFPYETPDVAPPYVAKRRDSPT